MQHNSNDHALRNMFTAVISSLDTPARLHLAAILQFCHTRRHNFPTREPVLFFSNPDHEIQAMAEPYLFTNPQPSLPSTSELTPLNSCPLLAEDAIFARLDPAARAAYLAARTPLQEQASLVDLARRHYENPQPESQDHAHLNVPRNEPQSDDMVHGDDSCDEDLYSCSEYSYISHISDVTIDVDTTDVLLT